MRRLILEISEKELLKFGLEMQPFQRIRCSVKSRIQG